ncbi:MAG TPA: hypothetical protein VMM36_00885 [Opitutaceae bacterium]|nr:hypothetical protein [Opitutaceae bacterium]
MRIDLAPEDPTAAEQLLPAKKDRSGIGVHYVDTWLKPLRAGIALPSGEKFSAKRRGLRITLAIGARKGEGLMRRARAGGDPVAMLRGALDEAGATLGARLAAENGRLVLEL